MNDDEVPQKRIPRTQAEIREVAKKLPPAPEPSAGEIAELKGEHGTLYGQHSKVGGWFYLRVPALAECAGVFQGEDGKGRRHSADHPVLKLVRTHTVYPPDAASRFKDWPGLADALASTYVRQLGLSAVVEQVDDAELTDEEADALDKSLDRAQAVQIFLGGEDDDEEEPLRITLSEPDAGPLRRLKANLFSNLEVLLKTIQELTLVGDASEALADCPLAIIRIANHLAVMSGASETTQAKKV